MKTEQNILIAFVLNLTFSLLEFAGGLFTGSVAILSDALHDLGDAASIGIACFLEKKSKRPPDETHTYGYMRYSVLGSLITTVILLLGSAAVICGAVNRLRFPTAIRSGWMIAFAAAGVCVNGCAAFFTRDGSSLNQKAVNLHMLEDVLSWAVVLIGGTVIHFTGLAFIDPLMSLGVAVFILIHAAKNLTQITDLFLEKAPHGLAPREIRSALSSVDGVLDIHHIHVRSIDGRRNDATMHIVTGSDPQQVKEAVRRALEGLGITHATLELERENEHCREIFCSPAQPASAPGCHHHHPHHHHHAHHHHIHHR